MQKQAGLSLVELLISITLGLLLVSGVVQVFVSSKTTFSTQQAMSRVQETGRLAVEFLSRDIRMAAYYGCVRPAGSIAGDLVVGGLHGNFVEGVRGYESADDIPGSITDNLGGMTLLPAENVANVVVVRSANEAGVPITQPNTSDAVYGYTQGSLSSGCVGDICDGATLVATDCTKVRIFQASGLDLNANLLTVFHADAWGGGLNPLENFTSGEVMPINTVVYFLAEGASEQPTLWQKINTDPAVELLEGVEQMRITYAINNGSNYLPASALAADDWALVSSIRIELLVRSLDNNVVDQPQAYTFDGTFVNPAIDDRYLRQVFSTTVSVRSRTVLN